MASWRGVYEVNETDGVDVEEEKINSFFRDYILVFTTETPSGFCYIVRFMAAKEVKMEMMASSGHLSSMSAYSLEESLAEAVI
jgi:hypothetical protein